MKTDELINALSLDVAPVPRLAFARQLVIWLLPAAIVSILLMLVSVGLRPDLVAALGRPAIWVKFAIVLALSGAALAAVAHASRPDQSGQKFLTLFGVLVIAAAAGGFIQLLNHDSSIWMRAWLGSSSAECPFIIMGLSVPLFVAIMFVMRQAAPANARIAGAAAGLLAGGLSAFIYALHCGEAAIMFIATWYVGGIVAVGALGALIGPRVLRW
ncbi:MAG TPA: DUF1109 domain-containing protein [Micropepsaceae bacterium]|nr:DUF1109 domain-containing protein [Micropepsaceae bacterium]